MRVTLLMLPLALFLSTATFGAPSTEPTPLTTEQLEQEIFGAPESMSRAPVRASEWWGVCSLSCAPCWLSEDCGYGEFCTWACY